MTTPRPDEDASAGPRETQPTSLPSPNAMSVTRRVAIGAAFMVGARLAIRGLSTIGMLLLARLLVPEDFGLVVLAAAVVGLTEMLAVTSYGQLLVRHPDASPRLYNTAWTLNLIRCALLAALVAATAEWQAGLMGDPRIGPILHVTAIAIMLDGFTSIGIYRLQRELQFDRIFRYQVVNKIISFTVSVALAIILGNYWCLILGNLAAKIVCVPYSYWLAPHRPRISFRQVGELLHFSKWMLAINLCMTANSHGINLVIGRWAGVQALGSYQVSYYLAAVPVHEIAVPVRDPIYAGYAKVQHDLALLRHHFVEGFAFLVTLMVPLSIGIALTAPQATRLALGPSWEHAVPLVALCALFSLADCFASFSTNIFFVLDRLKLYVKTLSLLMVLRMAGVVLAAMYSGVEAIAAVMVATAVLNALLWHWQVARLLGHSLHAVFLAVWRSAVAALAMSAAVLGLQAALPVGPLGLGQAMREMVSLAAVGAVTHIGTQALLWRLSGAPDGPERRLVSLGLNLAGALRRRAPKLLWSWR